MSSFSFDSQIGSAVGRVPHSCCRLDPFTSAFVDERQCLYNNGDTVQQQHVYLYTKVAFDSHFSVKPYVSVMLHSAG